ITFAEVLSQLSLLAPSLSFSSLSHHFALTLSSLVDQLSLSRRSALNLSSLSFDSLFSLPLPAKSVHRSSTPSFTLNRLQRTEFLLQHIWDMKGLANKFGLAVVVTNQVVDFIGPHDKVNGVRLGNLESLDTSGRRVSPVLGLAWAHCINSRVFLADMSNLLRSTFVMLLQQAYVVKHKDISPCICPTSGLCIGRICNQKRRYSRSITITV
ncbi:homolog of X-ray repair cross complementing 3, partial [Prunus dulcis]